VDDARLRRQQLRDAEPGIESHQQQERRREPAQMTPRRLTHHNAPRGTDHQALSRDVYSRHADGSHQRGREQDMLDELQKGQLKHIEGCIAAQYRIGGAEGNSMTRHQPDIPLRGCVHREQNRDDRRRAIEQRLEAPRSERDDMRPLRRHDGELASFEPGLRQPDVPIEDHEGEHEHDEGERGTRGQRAQENIFVAYFAEPQPVGVEQDQIGRQK
jgi:hypothetical protein